MTFPGCPPGSLQVLAGWRLLARVAGTSGGMV